MKVVISAGGTGGHIYPALSIINKIKELEPKSKFLYIGTHNRIEKDIVPKYGIPFETIEVYGFNRKNIFKNIKTLICLQKSKNKVKKLIKNFNPDVVIGVGGYVTVPVILTAHKLGYKTFIHEQNSVAGKANIYISKYADKIGISFPTSKKYFDEHKVVLTGNPCGENALKADAITKKSLGLSEKKKLVLIVMGSLGSKTILEFMANSLGSFKDSNYQVLFVTGPNYYDSVKNNKYPKNVFVVPYIENMAGLLKNVDVIVSRAGASTLAEILSLKVPNILIPSPYVPNNHQFMNAKDFVDAKASLMIEEKDLNIDILKEKIDLLINDENLVKEMKKNMAKLAINDSSTVIYKELKKLIGKE